ncbi:ATP-binding cassette domain-containing protein [Rhodococcus sp. IEGM 248]|nr:ATP-binding cassette domain-containing protein [Rhodococcus sp. IEGM 248]
MVDGDKHLLVDISLGAEPGSLTAMIGPSGAGKSTLAKVIAGSMNPSGGVVIFEGRNLHAEYQVLRSRIGLVPQDDVLHRHGPPGPRLRGPTAIATGYDSRRSRPRDRRGTRGTLPDRACGHSHRPPLGRPTQACLRGTGAADRSVTADSR